VEDPIMEGEKRRGWFSKKERFWQGGTGKLRVSQAFMGRGEVLVGNVH